jgi:metal-sulfur cluster biosynthetic enzyme
MGATIKEDMESRIRALPGIKDVDVELVWDPPWNQSMMSERAKLQLGMV